MTARAFRRPEDDGASAGESDKRRPTAERKGRSGFWSRLFRLPRLALLSAGALASVFPFYWMWIAGTHRSGEVLSVPPPLLPGAAGWENLAGLEESIGLARVLFNSVFIATSYAAVGTLICAMAGFAFAKYRFRGRDALFALILGGLMLPPIITIVPLFRMVSHIGLLNTWWAVILPQLGSAFGVFFMRQNMLSFPQELIEAARLDGSGEWQIFWRVALPVMRAPVAALAIYLFLFQWNDFLWPLVVLSRRESYTLPVAFSTLNGSSIVDYGQLMMGAFVSTLPVMVAFLLLQRHFISGILGGAVKQ